MYPEIFEECPCTATTVIESSLEAESILNEIIPWVKPDADTQAITKAILEGLEGIRDILDTDVQAAYDGDPAARPPRAGEGPAEAPRLLDDSVTAGYSSFFRRAT